MQDASKSLRFARVEAAKAAQTVVLLQKRVAALERAQLGRGAGQPGDPRGDAHRPDASVRVDGSNESPVDPDLRDPEPAGADLERQRQN